MNATASPSLSLRRNISWTLLGNVTYALSQWGMLVLLARLSSPHTVGQYSLALAVSAPVFMALNLQLRGVQATDAARSYRFGDYLALRALTTFLALLVVAGLMFYYSSDTRLVIGLVAIAKAFEAMSDVLYGRMQALEKMDTIARSTLIKGPLSLIALFVGYSIYGLPGAAGLLAAGWLLLLLSYDLPNSLRLGKRNDLRSNGIATIWRLTKVSFPLGIVMGLVSLNTNLPRYQIQSSFGAGALGIYSALAYLMVALSLVINAIGQSVSPRLSRYYAENDKSSFKQLLYKMISAGIVLGLVGIVISYFFGNYFLNIFYGPNYSKYSSLLVLLVISSLVGFLSSFLGYAMTAAQKFKEQVPLFITCVLLTGFLSTFLVPKYGLYGATWASLISNAAQLFGATYITVHALREQKGMK